jgi:hypothetical protein
MSTTARRRFLKSLAVAPLVPSAAALVPQAAPTPAPPTATPSPSASPDAPGPMAWALTEAVRQRFGAHLTAEELAEVAKGIDGNLQTASRLRDRMRHGNADEPVTLFEARPAASAPPAPAAPPARSRRRRGGK